MMANLLRNHIARRLLVCVFLLITSYPVIAQSDKTRNGSLLITLDDRKVPLGSVLKKIERQSKLRFNYQSSQLDVRKIITAEFNSRPLDEVLTSLIKPYGFNWYFIDNYIALEKIHSQRSEVSTETVADTSFNVSGIVINTEGVPLIGATISLQGTSKGTVTDDKGAFMMERLPKGATLVISYMGFNVHTIVVSRNAKLSIRLTPSDNKLDETIVMGYGITSPRLNTGSISKISSVEISKQPVNNVLGALQGRIPGLLVSETNGNPGAAFKVQVRGQNSIGTAVTNDRVGLPDNPPLFLVDGVPFPGSDIGLPIGSLTMASGALSPLASLSPNDIASIEVLKDADATAIYGSRGANGVVIITTKKGEQGKAAVNVRVSTGSGEVTRRIRYLNTEQYLSMRREAFENDGVTPTMNNAGDLLGWDNDRYIDWQDLLIGGTAQFTNASASLTGGGGGTTYLISGNYNRQTTVYPGSFADRRANLHSNIAHTSPDKKFSAKLNVMYSNDQNNLPANDLITFINLPPNAPYPVDKNGNLVWTDAGFALSNNPFLGIYRKAKATTDNLNANLNLSYRIFSGLNILANLGYTNMQLNQVGTTPISSRPPGPNVTGSAVFGNSYYKNWIAEPQLEYRKNISKGTLNVLLGTTFQSDSKRNSTINADGYTNDQLLEAPQYAGTAAQNVRATVYETEYRYQAVFGRVSFNWERKYLLNLTGRRDGSSRFGPGKRYANFGAVGGGWIFSEEAIIRDKLPVLSFGKIRGSFGSTGSDQITDYGFLDTYVNAQFGPGLIPGRLFNPDFAWEVNRKLEFALELGLAKNRMMLTAGWYRNRSGNQLVSYKLPIQTGFNSILENFNAEVQNTGWEISLNTVNIKHEQITWNTNFNVSIPRNKLLRFPGLETSSYANALIIGQPITIVKLLDVIGVDEGTGMYQFAGTSRPADQVVIKDLGPRYYGGLNNSIQYKGFDFSFFLQFVKQLGFNYLLYGVNNAPGTLLNQPAAVLSRWQKPGDQTDIQRFTTTGTARSAYLNYAFYSEARVTDASFLRIKNAAISYSFPLSFVQRLKLNSARFYIQGQNLLTITDFKGTDPETNSATLNLPPLRIITCGIQIGI